MEGPEGQLPFAAARTTTTALPAPASVKVRCGDWARKGGEHDGGKGFGGKAPVASKTSHLRMVDLGAAVWEGLALASRDFIVRILLVKMRADCFVKLEVRRCASPTNPWLLHLHVNCHRP